MLLPIFVIVFIRYLIPKALTNYYLSSSSETEEEQQVCLQKNKEEAEQQVITDDVCSKLDSEMFGEIFARLHLSDQARFRGVCKTWLLAAAPDLIIYKNIYTQTKPLLPWYAHFNRVLPSVSSTLEFRIYDTSSLSSLSSSSSLLHIISLTKLHIPTPLSYSNIFVACHKNWFLIDITKPRFFNSNIRRYFFLYSYITKKVIKLPTFDFNPVILFRRTFTTNPDSPTCVFVLVNGPIIDRFVIVTCRKGDTEWTVREFPNTGGDAFLHCNCTPLFFRGMLYIVSPYGQLASYNVVDGEFRFVSLDVDHHFALNYDSSDKECRIFELNGELMILYFVHRIENITTFPTNQCLKQFDWSNKVWVPVSSLGGKTLLLSNKIYRVAEINTEQIGYNGILSNKIYYHYNHLCVIYSLEDGELVGLKSINMLEGGVAYRDYNNGTDQEETDTDIYMFLEPPVLVH